MRFNILHIEPQNYAFAHFLHTISKALCVGIESLGHDCCMLRNTLDARRTAIVVGGHLISSPSEVEAIASNGPYVVYQSEVVSDPAVAAANWTHERFTQVYVPLLKRARVVWDALEENLPFLAQIGANAKLLRLGHHPALEEITPKRTKDIDFLFFGSITPHRQQMLSALQARGHQVVHMFDAQAHFRNDLIARAKIHLSIGHGPARPHLPWPRIAFLLNNRALVVSERLREQEWLEGCFAYTDSDRWVDLCVKTLLREDRERLAAEYYERFKSVSLTDQLAQVLDTK